MQSRSRHQKIQSRFRRSRLEQRHLLADLSRFFRLLKKVPLDGVKAVHMLKLLMGQWASMYDSPLLADLELLTTRLGILAQHLENGATFEEVTIDKDENDMCSHLQHI